ncbi:MAG: PQQ-dependent sugar dehydrogenase [Xanthobacteraceae bacterium]|nr:PQQ-dependent sugar dehydrogenase [Xanthobacteraceae bacterium]
MSWSRMWQVAIAIMVATFASSATADAQTLSLELMASGLPSPVGLRNAGDGSNRLFIVNQGGTISIYKNGSVLATPFLDVSSEIVAGGEQGLLGLAFDPSYATNGFFYIYYTSKTAGTITISRFHVSSNPDVADPTSEVVLITQVHPNFTNHNGGSLLFGPDGCLYAGLGDGGSGGDPNNNAQNLGTLLAKIIRISPAAGTPCTAAPGNPFVNTQGARGEIWALGVRNPWRITFDRQTGDLWIADVGQNTEEEVDLQPSGVAGRNYCWSRKEGTLIYNPNIPCTIGMPTDPIIEYDHSAGKCAIIGGYRYRGSRFPRMLGTYFYADLCTGQIFGATESGGVWTSTALYTSATNVTTFGEDEAGELYVVHLGGTIHRLDFGALASSHDFNGDTKSDIAWRDTGGDVAIWLMNGAQVAESAVLGPVDSTWSIVGQHDFDGDGKRDLLWHNTAGDTAIWFMNGTSITSSTLVGNVAGSWTIAGAADFNGDGQSDILWRDASGNTALWLMHGALVLSNGSLGLVPASTWSIVGTGDFDGDGQADILWRDASGDLSIWFMNGLSVASSSGVTSLPLVWSVVGTGDFDGDGRSDILLRDTNGDMVIWLMNGAQIAGAASLGAVSNAFGVAITGDFDGDGRSDILWRDGSGNTSVWFMNGTQVASTATVGTIPTRWTVQAINAE